MYETLTFAHLLKRLKHTFDQIPEARTGHNLHYELSDAGLAAFSVFFTQKASFLAHQRDMKRDKGHSNAERVFGLRQIPSDPQIRNRLDPIDPASLEPNYAHVFHALEQAEVLEAYRSFGKQLLVALDGTVYFSSKAIHCDACRVRELPNGESLYTHTVLMPVIVNGGHTPVLPLEPEFITPQDGHEKQDCEIQAAKRWLNTHGVAYARYGITFLGDDLYSHQPFCQAVQAVGSHFILVCKPESHPHLYATVDYLAAQKVLGTLVVSRWTGRYREIATYRFAPQLALTGDRAALEVNWCEVTITREDTQAQLYKNTFITDFPVLDTTVEAIVRDGRARWKIENENNNTLKTKGYHLEHNFGHGTQHLAALLLSLNWIAFLWHSVFELVDEQYRRLRAELGPRQTFFQDIDALLRYWPFDTWAALMDFMTRRLDLAPPS